MQEMTNDKYHNLVQALRAFGNQTGKIECEHCNGTGIEEFTDASGWIMKEVECCDCDGNGWIEID